MVLAFLIVLLQLPSVSCTNSSGPRFCVPQYQLRFLDIPNQDQNLLEGVKDLLKLLSYMAVDLNYSDRPTAVADYDDINLVNTFSPLNVFKINFLGFCKEQHAFSKLPTYCVNNKFGLEPISMIVRDLGVQFGIISSKNPRIMGESFVYAFKTGLNTFKDPGKNGFLSDGVFSKFVAKGITSGSQSNTAADVGIANLKEAADWLIFMQDFCQVIGLINLIEFCVCVIIVLSTLLLTPAAIGEKRSRSCRVLIAGGNFALKVLPAFFLVVSFLDIFSLSAWFVTLNRASSSYGLAHKFYELALGGGFYIAVVRFVLGCALLGHTVRLNKVSQSETFDDMTEKSTKGCADSDHWQKDLETASILSSGTTI